ncbi:MAG: hypothetical protein ACYCQJ_15585 [Nitrososphaerales archaeon]
MRIGSCVVTRSGDSLVCNCPSVDLVLETANGVTLSQGEVPSESPYRLEVVEEDGTKINVWKDYFTIDYEEKEFLAHIERGVVDTSLLKN